MRTLFGKKVFPETDLNPVEDNPRKVLCLFPTRNPNN